MQAKLYLERINQEMINKRSKVAIIAAIDKQLSKQKFRTADWGGNVWDKSCCIINIGKRDPDIYELNAIGQFIMMRREKFGGLVWVRKTNAVYQVDEQAFMVLSDLDGGVDPKKIAKSANVTLKSIKALVAQLKTPVSARMSRV